MLLVIAQSSLSPRGAVPIASCPRAPNWCSDLQSSGNSNAGAELSCDNSPQNKTAKISRTGCSLYVALLLYSTVLYVVRRHAAPQLGSSLSPRSAVPIGAAGGTMVRHWSKPYYDSGSYLASPKPKA